MAIPRQYRLSEIVVGAFSTGLGLFVLASVATTPASAAHSAIGPGVFPAIIGLGLMGIGLRLFFEAWAKRAEAGDIPALDLRAAAFGAVTFAAMILTLEWLGWIVAGSLMYLAIATAFGSRRIGTSLFLGLALTLGTFLLFDYGLDLSLPTGAAVEWLISRFTQPA